MSNHNYLNDMSVGKSGHSLHAFTSKFKAPSFFLRIATANLLRILRMRPLLLFQRSLVLGPVALFPRYHVADLDSAKGRKNSRIIREKEKKNFSRKVSFPISLRSSVRFVGLFYVILIIEG